MHGIIFQALAPLKIPVKHQRYYESKKTYITFGEVLEIGYMHSDDKENMAKHLYQIDIWSDNDLTNQQIYKQARELLEQAGFLFDQKRDFYEDDTRIYHIAMDVVVYD